MGPDFETLLYIVLLAGAVQGVLFCIPLLRYPNNRAPNRILAAFILLQVVDLIFACLNNSEIVYTYPHLYDLNASFPLLFTPIMYLYISVMTGKITRFRPRYLVHIVPFLAHTAFMYFMLYRLPVSAKLNIISETQAAGWILDRKMFLFAPDGPLRFGGIAPCSIAIAYMVGIGKRIRDYQRDLRSFYSDIGNKVLGVLVFFLVTASSIWVLVTVFLLSGAHTQIYPMIFYTIAIYVGTYKMVTIPEVFSGNRAMNALLSPPEDGERPRHENALERFHEYLRRSKSYLNPDVTIGDISGEIGVPVHQLSRALNLSLGKNFYQCVNELRIDEAKRMLMDERLSDISILSIGMDAGFNSKSTFNEVFKKMAGITPSEYRKRKQDLQNIAE